MLLVMGSPPLRMLTKVLHRSSAPSARCYPALAQLECSCDICNPDGDNYRAGQLPPRPAPVLVLFSGGVDSTLLAALAHAALPAEVCTVRQVRVRTRLTNANGPCFLRYVTLLMQFHCHCRPHADPDRHLNDRSGSGLTPSGAARHPTHEFDTDSGPDPVNTCVRPTVEQELLRRRQSTWRRSALTAALHPTG